MKSIEVLRKKTIAYKVDRFLLMHKKKPRQCANYNYSIQTNVV